MTTTDRLQGVRTTQAIKTPVVVATTANITLSGTQTIDGVAVVAGDRVLVKDQTDTTQNGIYNCAAGAWARALDFNSTQEIAEGTTIFVARGTVNAARVYAISTPSPAIGSAMAFVQVAALADGALFAVNNLSDLDDPAVALTNLGLTATAEELNTLDGIPALTGESLNLARVNSGETALEFVGISDIAWPRGNAVTLESVDLDTVTSSGSYFYAFGATNKPATSEGVMIVVAKNVPGAFQQISQFAFAGGGTGDIGDIYTRGGRGDPLVWTPWRRVQTDQTSLGVGQTLQDMSGSRTNGTSYQNTTGKPIQVNVSYTNSLMSLQVSVDNSTWVEVGNMSSATGSATAPATTIVPNNHYYRVTTSSLGSTVGTLRTWTEMR